MPPFTEPVKPSHVTTTMERAYVLARRSYDNFGHNQPRFLRDEEHGKCRWIYTDNLMAAKKFKTHHEVFQFIVENNRTSGTRTENFNCGDRLEIVTVEYVVTRTVTTAWEVVK